MSENNWLTVEETAKYLRVSVSTIYRMSHEDINGMGIIPHFRVGHRILFDLDELITWFRRGGKSGVDQQEKVEE